MDELAQATGATPPPEFDALTAEQRAALADVVRHAVRDRAALLDRGIEDSLRHLPALLRGPVKRVLGV